MIIRRKECRADLIEIWHYIATDSQTRADAFLDDLYKKFGLLEKKPSIGRLRDELMDDLRSLPHGRYIIFFLPLPDGVEIVRVLHSARDLGTIFHADSNE